MQWTKRSKNEKQKIIINLVESASAFSAKLFFLLVNKIATGISLDGITGRRPVIRQNKHPMHPL